MPQDDCLWLGFCVYSNELPGFMKDKEFPDHNQLIGSTVLKTCPQLKTSVLYNMHRLTNGAFAREDPVSLYVGCQQTSN